MTKWTKPRKGYARPPGSPLGTSRNSDREKLPATYYQKKTPTPPKDGHRSTRHDKK